MKKQLLLCILFQLATLTFAQTVQLGPMVKQTMKESWADIRPIGQDDQGVFYMMLPYGAVIAGPVIGDADYYIGLVNDRGELVKKQQVNFVIEGKESEYEFTQEINGKILVFTLSRIKNRKVFHFTTTK